MKIKVKNTIPGVQNLLHQILDADSISPMQLSGRSGVHFTTLYGILKRHENKRSRPVRRATITAIGEGLGYKVAFDHERNEITFTRQDIKPTKRNDIDVLLQEIRSALMQSGRKEFDEKEMEKIANVVRAMVG